MYVYILNSFLLLVGEGAAIACGASVFGLGSDIGGSLRIPAAWCGIPAIKPTYGRLSGVGRMASNPGQRVGKPDLLSTS